MITPYLLLLTITFLIAILLNYLRFKGSITFNKYLLIASSLLLFEFQGFFLGYDAHVILYLFITLAAFCFNVYGGVISAFLASSILFIHTAELNFFLILGYILYGFFVGYFLHLLQPAIIKRELWKKMLIKNSKQLNVFREVSTSMQQTYELKKILQIIVTSVTAGHGLGFNRAIILLVNDSKTKLQGIMGVGPMSAEEGYETWENITKNKHRLVDLIKIQGEEKTLDPKLNERVQGLEIALHPDNFLYQTLETAKPQHIKKINLSDPAQALFSKTFNIEEFVAFPLIHRGGKVGILLIDNPVNKKQITAEQIDSVVPLANQAAIAIQQSRMYTQIHDMALKDGLTGLLNQRAFQSIIQECFPVTDDELLSIVLLDIDSFKHFNDTNGHLLGNDVLVLLAQVIQQSTREGDYSFRFGGEEFIVLLPHTNNFDAKIIAERIRCNVEKTTFPYGENQPLGKLTVSVGVASTAILKEKSTNQLIDAADKALYEAKAQGKNQVVFYKESENHE
ncbi:sensor domain-containing diguanylate cyclase [Bacillus suaedae]|uniref:Sensor domain-containing diguanylate cyclase n=1 Tax=Halalkalibacter suaedae TaxID=2822140 RepID=A0A940WN68_9BACI|nr:sensor domain-containing diguanylate cyclase [Bacillus suaedae]MBP3949549.1 sensor domain-containing diguanylate cyclase [Bacillus suaedae]